MNAGPKRFRVTFQSLVETKDGYGQKVESWLDVATYWAAIRNLTGRELINAKQVKAESHYMIIMRYVPGITPSMRAVCDGINYNIVSLNNVDMRKRELRIEVQELVSP
jgi:SPP1 family predicted phage head-tail adaptor